MNRMTDAQVLYVDPSVTWLAPLKDKAAKPRLRAWKQGGKKSREHSHVTVFAAPPVLPFYNKYRAVNRFNQKRIAKWLASVCRENGFDRDFLLWCYSPASCDVVEPLAAELGMDPAVLWRRTVYDCVDRHSAYPGLIDPAVVDGQEQDLASRCGMVFATAKGLYERLKAFNPNCHLVPNGAAYELFSQTAQLPKKGSSPHFGFVGMLQECIDYGIMRALAEAFPEGRLTLIGRTLPGVDIGWIKEYPNIEYAGLLPQTELPARMADFDVCLNIFADNDLSRDVSPLKFYEYLATGKPVVSTPVPYQVRDYADCIYIAETAQDFVRKCRQALEEPADSPLRAKRMEAGRQCSWDQRVATMRLLLQDAGITAGDGK